MRYIKQAPVGTIPIPELVIFFPSITFFLRMRKYVVSQFKKKIDTCIPKKTLILINILILITY